MSDTKQDTRGLAPLEFIILFIIIFTIIVTAAYRYTPAASKSAVAAAKKNLRTIHALETTYFDQHSRFGELSQINFKFPAPSHPFNYMIIYDDNTFQAVAQEKKGFDPRENGRTGDEIITIDENGYLGL